MIFQSGCSVQVLFPLLALVPRREVSKDTTIGVTAPLLGSERDAEEGQQPAVGDVLATQSADEYGQGCDGTDGEVEQPGTVHSYHSASFFCLAVT